MTFSTRRYLSGRKVPMRIAVKLDKKQERELFKALDGFSKKYGLTVALTAMSRYVNKHRAQMQLEAEIAEREQELADMRKKTAAR